MTTISIIIVPVLIMTLWLFYISLKERDWSMSICMPLIVGAVIFLFIVLHIEWCNRNTSTMLLSVAHWIFDFIPVLTYIFICTRCHQKWYKTTTFVLLTFIFLNLSPGITMYLDDIWGAPSPQDDRLYIYSQGVSVFNIKLWQACMALQFVWIACRIIKFIKKMEKRHLHLSDNSKKLTTVILTLIAIAFMSLFLPVEYWFATEIPLYTIFILVSIGMCVSLYMLIKGFAMVPIVDPNNEPAIFTDDKEQVEIWDKIKKVIEEKRMYLQPDINLAQIAQLAGTNRTYVTSSISKNTGTNFKGYINHLRIAYATGLIVSNPDMKLEEIAERCGFKSASTFSKIYKNETGHTPKESSKYVN